MECSDFQKKISEYIDRVLSSGECASIEKHLESCGRCRDYLKEMKKSLEYIKNMDEVEPPAWLKGKIMAAVKEEAEERKGFFRKLFYPLYIKLPLEAAAAVLIAVASVYLFRTMPPEVKMVQVYPETAPPVVTEEKDAVRKKEVKKPSLKKAEKHLQIEEKVLPAVEGSPSPPSAGIPPLLESKKDSISVRGIEASKAPVSTSEKGEVLKSEESSKTFEMKKKVSQPAFKTGIAAESVKVTIFAEDTDSAFDNVKKTISQLGGKLVRKIISNGKTIILSELDRKKEADFLEKLGSSGDVKVERGDLPVRDGMIIVRIEIIKK